MAETNWILNLVNRVTGPMRDIAASISDATKSVTRLDDANTDSQEKLSKSLEEELTHRKQVLAKIKEQEDANKDLERAVENAVPGAGWQEAEHNLERGRKKISELNEQLKESNEDISELKSRISDLPSVTDKSFTDVAIGFNQFSELISKVSKSFDFSIEMGRTRNDIERMTGATGSALDDITGRVHVMGRVFHENDDQIAQAANSLKNSMGISYNDAIDLIEKGYTKGADVGGKMLQNLQQYAPQMKEMGVNASQMIALMADAAQKGIPTDKAIAAFDQANESIRERGPRTVAALKGIGIEVEDLSKKSSFETMQIISKAMDGASENAKALVLRDVFKNAGKDVGTKFVEGIGSVDMNLDNIPSVVEAGTGFQKFLGGIENLFARVFGNAGVYIQQFAVTAGTLNNVVGVIATLSKVTWLQNIAQKALNITTRIFNTIAKAGPWGWIALAITGVITVISYLGDKFEWAAGIVGGVKNSFLDFGKVLLDWVLLPIKSVLAGLGAIGNAIAKLFSGHFSEAWDEAKKALSPVKELVNDIKTVGASYQKGSNDAIDAMRKRKAEEGAGLSASGDAENKILLGDIPSPDDKTKNKKSKSDGLNISGAGGVKAITMNLEIKNYFNNVKGNVREIANQIAGQVNDRLRDALVTN